MNRVSNSNPSWHIFSCGEEKKVDSFCTNFCCITIKEVRRFIFTLFKEQWMKIIGGNMKVAWQSENVCKANGFICDFASYRVAGKSSMRIKFGVRFQYQHPLTLVEETEQSTECEKSG
ncbi:hypothetical protein VNO78_17211 [Psophocarpus tetragonolobus]|uniref:Uncharacterized protein n=1 Tax=Psophocarpus tetragonolobus TaxID=3891 RepID=A0AAN9SIT4_PSOTE